MTVSVCNAVVFILLKYWKMLINRLGGKNKIKMSQMNNMVTMHSCQINQYHHKRAHGAHIQTDDDGRTYSTVLK